MLHISFDRTLDLNRHHFEYKRKKRINFPSSKSIEISVPTRTRYRNQRDKEHDVAWSHGPDAYQRYSRRSVQSPAFPLFELPLHLRVRTRVRARYNGYNKEGGRTLFSALPLPLANVAFRLRDSRVPSIPPPRG